MNKKNIQDEIDQDEISEELSYEALKEKISKLENELASKDDEINKLEKALDDCKSKATSYLNTASYYKSQAEDNKKDFDRYKERNKNIEKDAQKNAYQSVAKKILPTMDNFNHAMEVVSPDVMQGFIMIYSSLLETLKELGVSEIVCKNQKLDPEKHNCLESVETDNEELDGYIEKVYQKGYFFEDTNEVIRPANVSVYKYNAN